MILIEIALINQILGRIYCKFRQISLKLVVFMNLGRLKMYKLKTPYKNRHRQEEIHNFILHLGFVRIIDIAEQFEISLATVRRDLDALERRALIERTWGGAKVRSPIRYLSDFEKVAAKQIKAKRAIAARANKFVKDGMIIGLSGGTTCTEFARWLRGRSITVVTNAINVATELYNHSHTKVIVTGGHLNSYSYELVGEIVDDTLSRYKLDISFLGVSGIDQEFGFSMRDSLEASIARAFLHASKEAIVIADHTKIDQKAMAEFAPFSEIEYLVTDEAISQKQISMLNKAGLKLSIAPGLQS